MPRLFLHLIDDLDVPDEEGAEFEDVEAAKNKAVYELRSLACEKLMDGCLHLSHRIDIEADDGELVMSVALRDAIRIED